MLPAGTSPTSPLKSCVARAGTSIRALPASSVRVSVVSNRGRLGVPATSSVPAAIVTAPVEVSSRKNVTRPWAKSLVLRSTPRIATTRSSDVPLAVSTKPDW